MEALLIPEANYTAGDVFEITSWYSWHDSPAPDVTVRVYTKQSDL